MGFTKNLKFSWHISTSALLEAVLPIMLCTVISTVALAKTSETAIEGRIKVPRRAQKNYYHLARITLQDAIRIAQATTQGHVISSALEVEEGYLIYAVNLDKGDDVVEVIVDAGTGKILATEKEDKNRSLGSESESED